MNSLCYLLNDFYQLVSLLVCGDTVTNAIAQWLKQQKSISSQFKVPTSKIKMSFRQFLSEIFLLVFYIFIFISFLDGHPSGLFVCFFIWGVCVCVSQYSFPISTSGILNEHTLTWIDVISGPLSNYGDEDFSI